MCKIGRASIVIDFNKLQSEINLVEASETFNTYTELCAAVSAYDTKLHPSGCCKNSKHVPRIVHPSQVYLAIQRGDVTVKTEKGKRGRTMRTSGVKSSKAHKFQANPKIVESLKIIRDDMPDSQEGLFEQLKNGSYKAAIKAKCLQCYNFSNAYKTCDSKGCALHPLNLLLFKRIKEEPFIYNPLSKNKKICMVTKHYFG